MRLTSLIASSDNAQLQGEDRDITGITDDSRKVQPGFLFAAIPGTEQNGQKFIDDAITHGAAAILIPLAREAGEGGAQSLASASDWEGEGTLSTITTPHIRKTLSAIAAKFYPRQPETIVAVTGTSGKTSTVQFVREIWQTLGHNSASIGSFGYITPDEHRYSSINTPDPVTLHAELQEAADHKITHLAMEASSHGLAMHRMDGVRMKAAAFTNLSRDHLDYHTTMDEYFTAKQRLFTELLPEGAPAILNADAPEFELLTRIANKRKQNIIDYGRNGKEIKLLGIEPSTNGQIIRVAIFAQKYEILLPLLGEFQTWNALCALGLVAATGGDVARAAKALEKVSGVRGRLELAGRTKNGAAIFVDYAHKPDALENVLKTLRTYTETRKGAKLGVVFGCGGNRDKGKRPMMGEIARRLADWVIVTDDNPRHEDPATIRKEILAGATLNGHLQEIGDRAKAISAGIERLKAGDVLIIAGKGHETGQIVGDKTLPFDDADVARQVLDT